MQQNHYAMNICASENKIPWKIPGKFFRRPKPAAEKNQADMHEFALRAKNDRKCLGEM